LNDFTSRRSAIFLRRASPADRIALAILFLFIVTRIAAAVGRPLAFSGWLGFAAIFAALFLIIRIAPKLRDRLLWSLRSRLIVAYVFIAVVPVVLLLAMAGVASSLLYLQLGAHLLQDDLQDRVDAIDTAGQSLARAVRREMDTRAVTDPAAAVSKPDVQNVFDAVRADWPNLQLLINRGQQLLQSRNSEHFAGVVEFEGNLYVASVIRSATKQGPLCITALAPLDAAFLDGFSRDLGPIQLTLFRSVAGRPSDGLALEAGGKLYVPAERIDSVRRAVSPKSNFLDIRIAGISTTEAVHFEPIGGERTVPVWASFSVRPSAMNRQLFSSVGAVGPVLLQALFFAGIFFLLLEVFALATGVVLTRTITHAVADLYQATLHVRRGDFSHRVRVQRRDQLGALGESFNEMTSSITDLIEHQRQRQKLENEISIAREVQDQLFPKKLPDLPGLEIAAICRAARSVSGDYYDFLRVGPESAGIALADISGKGIFAALLMASLQAALRSYVSVGESGNTAELVDRLNRHVFRNTSDDRYATFFYAHYDAGRRTLTYTNAGHLAPFLISDSRIEPLEEGGTVIGLFEDYPYTQMTKEVAPGTLLVIFSDGLTEPENVYGEEFGSERLKAEILRHRNLPVRELAERLIAAAEQWAGTPEQADDMTVVVARMG
jgi:sigma-B regulation protein RsbU (phosphoserine phosphatase)